MIEEITFLVSGIVFGLTAGILPGPLLTLVISEALKYSKKEGIKVAIAPLLTDLPIILVTVLILSKLSNFNLILGFISIMGAMFIGYLAYESISMKRIEIDLTKVKAQSLKKGIIANFLNPHPYMFWFAVGSPMVLKALSINVFSATLFISGFYVFLVGSKILVAILAEKSRSFLKSNAYVYVIKFLGVILLFFAFIFLREGLKFLEII